MTSTQIFPFQWHLLYSIIICFRIQFRTLLFQHWSEIFHFKIVENEVKLFIHCFSLIIINSEVVQFIIFSPFCVISCLLTHWNRCQLLYWIKNRRPKKNIFPTFFLLLEIRRLFCMKTTFLAFDLFDTALLFRKARKQYFLCFKSFLYSMTFVIPVDILETFLNVNFAVGPINQIELDNSL